MSHQTPHPSHDMSPWRSTVVTLVETPRFGEVRKCRRCGAEHARTVAGEAMHEELRQMCEDVADLWAAWERLEADLAELSAQMSEIHERLPGKEHVAERERLLQPLRVQCQLLGMQRYNLAARLRPRSS